VQATRTGAAPIVSEKSEGGQGAHLVVLAIAEPRDKGLVFFLVCMQLCYGYTYLAIFEKLICLLTLCVSLFHIYLFCVSRAVRMAISVSMFVYMSISVSVPVSVSVSVSMSMSVSVSASVSASMWCVTFSDQA